jgi:hypothetical protein
MLKQLLLIVFILIITAPLALSATKFISEDDKTGGDWKQKYGKDGYIFCNVKGPVVTIVNGGDAVKKNYVAKLPDYIKDYTLGGGIQGYVWQAEDKRQKILVQPDGKQIPACWFTGGGDFTVDFPLKGRSSYTMAIYIDDWENGGRKESLTLKDLETGDELTTHDFEKFGVIGKYGVFEVDRSVQLLVHYIPSYGNAVVSGVFFHGGLAVVRLKEKLAMTWGEIKNQY